jgi:hypothetical protein
MDECSRCGHRLVRIHRTPAQKIFFSEAYRCSHCRYPHRVVHPSLDVNLAFFASRYTCCVRCGNRGVRPLKTRDLVERTSRHPVSQLFRLAGAPLRLCPLCRLQYNDWRPIAPPTVHR